MRFTRSAPAAEWLGLGEASRLLGVAPGTLRRWSDTGRVRAFTTPGGHRRFRRSALERLIPGDAAARPSLVVAGMTPSRLARAYRAEARSAVRQLPWLTSLGDEQRAWFREHGRELAGALLGHLDAPDEEAGAARLAVATSEAAAYGRMAASLGVSLSQAVEGFLQFRRPFLHELALVARRRGFDATATTDLLESADAAMDRLLVATMAAHSVGRVRRRSRPAGVRLVAREAEAGSTE
jgi:excisionase family DNA binding protein